jgi:hypothetical protein
MALNPQLRLMVDNAHAKYGNPEDPLLRKRAEILAAMEAKQLSATEQLMVLGLRKASKKELQQIVLNVIAGDI